MIWYTFIAEVVLLSLSGVMAPGPLTAVVLNEGSRNPRAGILLSFGHGIVEIPLMILLFLGFGAFLEGERLQQWLLAGGGVVLLAMGIQIMLSVSKPTATMTRGSRRTPLISGVVLSGGNPYFIVWWSTVGLTLISRSSAVGALGFPVMVLVHWLCDLCWLCLLSAVSFKAGASLGVKFQRGVAVLAGLVVLIFAARFLGEGAAAILSVT